MLSLLRAFKDHAQRSWYRRQGRPFESETGPDAWVNGDEIHCYTMTRAEARVLARYWLRIHGWEKLKVEYEDGNCSANVAVCVEAEERYRELADLLGNTEVERISREVEKELGAPLLYRFEPSDGWKPTDEQKDALGVCPVCHEFDGVLAHDGEAWVYPFKSISTGQVSYMGHRSPTDRRSPVPKRHLL